MGEFNRGGQAMKIGNVMSRDVQLVKPDDTIRSAAALMKKIDAGLLPVTENDQLVGMITDRDIAIRGVAEGKGPDAKVRDAMSPEVKYCFEDEDVAHVAENMAELQIRRLPVMNRDKRLVGIISLADLAIEGSLPKTAKALHGISRPTQPEPSGRLTITIVLGRVASRLESAQRPLGPPRGPPQYRRIRGSRPPILLSLIRATSLQGISSPSARASAGIWV
jgi:CBS domain-containing protein